MVNGKDNGNYYIIMGKNMDYLGLMEKKMETTIMCRVISGFFRVNNGPGLACGSLSGYLRHLAPGATHSAAKVLGGARSREGR